MRPQLSFRFHFRPRSNEKFQLINWKISIQETQIKIMQLHLLILIESFNYSNKNKTTIFFNSLGIWKKYQNTKLKSPLIIKIPISPTLSKFVDPFVSEISKNRISIFLDRRSLKVNNWLRNFWNNSKTS